MKGNAWIILLALSISMGPMLSACQALKSGDSAGLDEASSKSALQAHNDARARVSPTPSTPLPDLKWDDELAETATDWANKCRFEHSDKGLGENLFVSSWEAEPVEVVESWEQEKDDYDYESGACSGVCGHYTQLVWRDTEKVGCGYADCEDISGFGKGRLWVCNYSPPGNWVGERPY